MKVTQALLGEHAVFTTLFTHLETRIPQADSGAEVVALGAMLQSALASHAQREDNCCSVPSRMSWIHGWPRGSHAVGT